MTKNQWLSFALFSVAAVYLAQSIQLGDRAMAIEAMHPITQGLLLLKEKPKRKD